MRALIAALILTTAIKANALGAVVSGGYAYAGHNLADTTGGDYEIQAGRGFHLLAGLIFPITPTRPQLFEAQLDVGYLFQSDSRKGDDNEIAWRRVPVELIYFYRNTTSSFRVGYGVAVHLANDLTGKGSTAAWTTDFDSAWGWVVQFDKIFEGNEDAFAVGLKYSAIKYHAPRFNADVDGSGLYVTASLLKF